DRHPHVHEDHGRRQFGGVGDGLVPVHRLRDDLDVGLGVQQDGETRAHHPLVISDHDTDGHDASCAEPESSGRAAVTRNSPFSVGPAWRWPPSMVARSRMPMMPCPPPSPGTPACSPGTRVSGGQWSLRTSTTRAASPWYSFTWTAAPGECA